MTRIADHRSIVAVDPSSRGLAFVFFENRELLDWGTRRGDGNEEDALNRLLTACRADLLVVEDPDARGCERRPHMRRRLRHLADRAQASGVTVAMVSRYEVRGAWARQGLRRKHAVAAAIGAMFPEIEPLVPRPRKIYRSEEARADIFDAVSLVLHAYGVERDAPVDDGSTSRALRACA